MSAIRVVGQRLSGFTGDGQLLALFAATATATATAVLALQHAVVQQQRRRRGNAIPQGQLVGHLEGLAQRQYDLAGQILWNGKKAFIHIP